MATEAGSIFVKVNAETAGFDRGMRRVEGTLGRVGSGSRMAARVITGAIASAVGVVGLATKAYGGFEQTLNVLEAQSGATKAQMDKLSATAVKLGADAKLPGTSAADAATAMLELSKGGLSVRQSMEAARGVLVLSAAAQIDNAEAATIVARQLKAFGLAGSRAAEVADILANAANFSTGSIQDFSLGLQQSAAVAKMTGLSINETTAMLMELADAGIVGSDAGTSLKTMLMSLSPQTEKAKKAFKDLGVETFDANGKFVGIRSVIGQFQRSLEDLTPKQRAQALQTIFGSDAIRAAAVIFGKGTKAFDDYVKATQKSGTATKMAGAQMKGVKGAAEGLKSAVETAGVAFGKDFAPAAERGIRGLTAWVNRLSESPRAHQVVQQAIRMLGSAVSETGAFFQAHKGQIVGFFQEAAAKAQAAWPAIQQFASGVGQSFTGLTGPLAIFRSGLMGSFGVVQQLVAALGGWDRAGKLVIPTIVALKTGQLAYSAALRATSFATAIAGMVGFTSATRTATTAQLVFNTAVRANPIGLLVGGLTAAATWFLTTRSGAKKAADGMGDLAQAADLTTVRFRAASNAFNSFAGSARRYKSALDALKGANQDVRGSEVALEAAQVARARAFQTLSKTAKEQGKDSLAYREALVAAKQANLDLVRAQQDVAKAKKAAKDAGVKADDELARKTGDVMDITKSYVDVLADANSEYSKTEALSGYRDELNRMAAKAGGTNTKLGEMVGWIARVSESLGRLPTRKEITIIYRIVKTGAGTGGRTQFPGSTGNDPAAPFDPASPKASFEKSAPRSFEAFERSFTEAAKRSAPSLMDIAKTETGKPIARGIIEGFLMGARDLPSNITDSVRTALDRARERVDGMRGALQSAFQRVAEDAFSAFDARTQQMKDAITTKYQGLVDAVNSELAGKLGQIEGARAAMTPTEALIAGIEDQRTQQQLQRAVDDAQRSLQEAYGSGDQAQILAAQQQLADAELEQKLSNLRKQAETERTERDRLATEAAAQAQTEADGRITALQAQQAEEEKQLDAQRALRRRKLQDQLDDLEEYLGKHPGKWKAVHKRIMGLFKDEFGPDFKTAGENLGTAFAQGLRDSFSSMDSAAVAFARLIAQYLKLNSPADKGPLSTLDRWWKPMADVLIGGVDTGRMQGFLDGVGGPAIPGVATAGAGAGGGPVYNIALTVNGSVQTERDLVDALQRGLAMKSRRSGALFSSTPGVAA